MMANLLTREAKAVVGGYQAAIAGMAAGF